MQMLVRLAKTLIIAALGGLVFWTLGFPAPWLAGPTIAVAAAALSNLEIGVPARLSDIAFVFLGAAMGSGVSPDSFELVERWPLSIALLIVCVGSMMIFGARYLERFHGFDRATARLCAVPGALNYVIAVAIESTADVRRVAILQTIRLTTLVVIMPFMVTVLYATSEAPVQVAAATASLGDIALLVVIGTLGGFIATLVRVPAPFLFGPMIASTVLYATGIVAGQLPDWLLIPGFVLIGAVIGVEFIGTDMAILRSSLKAGAASIVLLVGISFLFALPTALLLDLPLAQTWIAYAPGGVDAMAILALAMDLDPAFVGTHHVIRFLGLSVFVPLWLRGVGGTDDRSPGLGPDTKRSDA